MNCRRSMMVSTRLHCTDKSLHRFFFCGDRPAGTIIHAARGAFSLPTRCVEGRGGDPRPRRRYSLDASALRSDTHHRVWPPHIRRRVILAPHAPQTYHSQVAFRARLAAIGRPQFQVRVSKKALRIVIRANANDLLFAPESRSFGFAQDDNFIKSVVYCFKARIPTVYKTCCYYSGAWRGPAFRRCPRWPPSARVAVTTNLEAPEPGGLPSLLRKLYFCPGTRRLGVVACDLQDHAAVGPPL